MATVTEQIQQNTRELAELAEHALQYATKRGADGAKVATAASAERRLVVENKDFSLANSLHSLGFGIAIHRQGRKGSASSNAIDRKSVEQAVEEAFALAQYSVPDPNLTLASKDQAPPASSLDFLYDEALAESELESIQAEMQTLLGEVTRDERIALDRFEMAVKTSSHSLYNTLGVRQTEYQTMANWYYFGMARDGEQVSGFDYDGSFSYRRDDIHERARQDGIDFCQKVIGNLNPISSPSYRGAVAFSPRAAQEIFLSMTLYHTDGTQVMDNKSRWEQSVGEKVIDAGVTFRDAPHDSRFSGCTAFDSDGLPTSARDIIRNGILQTHLLGCYSAKKLGRQSNACNGAPFALIVEPGQKSFHNIIKDFDHILLVDRFSGNTDPLKGDFSGVAKSSRLFRKGEDVGAVSETMVAGNIFDSLNKIIGISQETRIQSGSFACPFLIVDEISVTGGA